MMRLIPKLLTPLCILAIMLTWSPPVMAQDFIVLSNSVPPFKDIKDDRPTGMAGDLLVRILKDTGHGVARARTSSLTDYLDRDRETPGTVFLALSKTPKNTPLFKWVGPIFSATSGIIVRKDRRIRLPRLRDARTLTLASVIGSAPETLLMGTALEKEQFKRFDSPHDAIRALLNETVDGVLLVTAPAYHLIEQEGFDPKDYETAINLDSIPLFFAFHPDTDAVVVHQLQKALEALKVTDQNGMSPHLKIISKYQ